MIRQWGAHTKNAQSLFLFSQQKQINNNETRNSFKAIGYF